MLVAGVDLGSISLIVVALVVLVLGLAYRRPLTELLRRATRVKARDYEIEAEKPEPPPALPTGANTEAPPEPPEAAADDQADAAVEAVSSQADEPDPDEVLVSGDADALRKLLVAVVRREDGPLAERVMDRLRQVEQDAHERRLDEVRYAFLRVLILSDSNAVERLRGYGKDDDVRAFATRLLASYEKHAGNLAAAEVAYRDAAAAETDREIRAQNIANQAAALRALGKSVDAERLLREELRSADGLPAAVLWRSLADVYHDVGNPELQAVALQKALESQAAEPSLRFDAAYAFSEANEDGLAPLVVHHYRHVVADDPKNATAWNNLGVQYSNRALKVLAVQHYRDAHDLGATLASANLAYIYINAGLADEAEALLALARKAPNPHQNVGSALAALDEERRQEQAEDRELHRTGQQQADFMSRHGAALLRDQSERFAGPWKIHGGLELSLTIDGKKLQCEWEEANTKRRIVAEISGETAKGTYEEMKYSTWRGERTEIGYSNVGMEWLHLDSAGVAIERMSFQNREVVFVRLERPTATFPSESAT